MEFKIGDKVKRKIGTNTNDYFNGGDTGTVWGIDEDKGYIDIKMDKNRSISNSNAIDNIELVKKSDYKPILPKKPTHIVVWDESCGDPCKFFISEKDAKDFIKELSEKNVVVKDSIILAEIKSCQKVNINKILKYSQHKI